jgi:hypothetical protein
MRAICAGFRPILSETAFDSGASADAVVPVDVDVVSSDDVGVEVEGLPFDFSPLDALEPALAGFFADA